MCVELISLLPMENEYIVHLWAYALDALSNNGDITKEWHKAYY